MPRHFARSSGWTSPFQIRRAGGIVRGVLVACDPVARVSVGRRMPRQYPDQLLAGVTRRPDDCNSIHKKNSYTYRIRRCQCILLIHGAVSCILIQL